LREALGDSAEHPHFVETLPRKGYRFVAAVTCDEPQPALADSVTAAPPKSRSRLWMTAVAAALLFSLALLANVGGIRGRITDRLQPGPPRISSVAVLPLENLSRDPEQDYFADGMTDELITDLAKMGSIRVTSRASVVRYKGTRKSIREIGRELNVDAIVEGTVTRSGNRARITVRLIQVSTDMHLWADAYEQDISEILGLQRKVATDIAHKVDMGVRPLEQARAVNPQAYGSISGEVLLLPVFQSWLAAGH